MPLTIGDEILRQVGLDEREALIEFACRLFDAGMLALWPAAQLANMSRVEFEGQLLRRNIPIYRPTVEDIEADLAVLKSLGI